ncbi:unnamed protein product [Gongylonema pulchrum]|uniref:BTB/POZ domain-containing protein n=1 Tax=Gongylonema pulchrum TaxID=637853 RepID=A0A183EV82_9BILA|nr:unnamed protein product [Gongylonema pulchrum]
MLQHLKHCPSILETSSVVSDLCLKYLVRACERLAAPPSLFVCILFFVVKGFLEMAFGARDYLCRRLIEWSKQFFGRQQGGISSPDS